MMACAWLSPAEEAGEKEGGPPDPEYGLVMVRLGWDGGLKAVLVTDLAGVCSKSVILSW